MPLQSERLDACGFRHTRRRAIRRDPRIYRPVLEALEPREMPSITLQGTDSLGHRHVLSVESNGVLYESGHPTSLVNIGFDATGSLPLVGNAHLSGSIKDASHYSLSASLPSVTAGAFKLTNDTVTLSAR
jgi:hypothetical protein